MVALQETCLSVELIEDALSLVLDLRRHDSLPLRPSLASLSPTGTRARGTSETVRRHSLAAFVADRHREQDSALFLQRHYRFVQMRSAIAEQRRDALAADSVRDVSVKEIQHVASHGSMVVAGHGRAVVDLAPMGVVAYPRVSYQLPPVAFAPLFVLPSRTTPA